MRVIERTSSELKVTWATAADSDEQAVEGFENFLLFIPTGFVGATVQVLIHIGLTDTFEPFGTAITVAVNNVYALSLTSGVKKIKLRSASATENKVGALLLGT